MATEVAAAEGAAARVTPSARPYSPSWVDLIMRWLEALPGPTWLAYAGLLAIALVVAAIEGWASGVTPFPTVDPLQGFFGVFFVLPLAILHYLDLVAGNAWDRFRPSTELDQAAADQVRYRLTVTPARGGLVLLALGYLANTLWFVADPVGTGVAGRPLTFVVMRGVIEGYLTAVLFVLVYQTIRQLRIVDHLHEAATSIDLFRPGAIHAMARLTSRSAMAIIFVAVLTGLPIPGMPEQTWLAGVIIFSAPLLVLAASAFFVPLRGLHARLMQEKDELQRAVVVRLRASMEALHDVVDAEAANTSDPERSRASQTRIDALSKAQAALIQERDVIARLSTWPWDPSTLRAVVSAIALPIVLFLITRALDHFI